MSKKRNLYFLLMILIVQLLLSVMIAGKKNYLFFDEVFSFVSANNPESACAKLPENQWLNQSWYEEYLGVQDHHRFEYQIPYKNQARDVHPPLFYILLHTICSMVPGSAAYGTGLLINIFFFLASSVLLFILGKEVFDSETCGLLVSFLYAVSYGGLNTVVYIRMYMLMTFMVLAHVLVYVRCFEKQEVGLKECFLLGITLVGGVLTQYYFLFVAFLLGLWYTVRLIYKKQYKVLAKYLLTIGASAVVYLYIWPYVIDHLFFGGRGKEVQSNILSLEGYFSSLKEMFRILSNEMFTKLLPVILVLMVILYFIPSKNREQQNKGLWKRTAVLLYLCMGYFCIVSKVSPYMVERYIMPIYPLVYLLVIGGCYTLLKRFGSKRCAVILCLVGFFALSAIHIVLSGIPYTYEKNENNRERHEIVESYQDHYAVYIADDKVAHFYDAIQMLKNYKGFYYIYDLKNTEQIVKDFTLLQNEQGLVIYVKNQRSIEEVNIFLEKIFPNCRLDDRTLIDIDDKWNVYYLNGI